MVTTILVPLDGSPLAERALPYATALARAAGARLVAVRAAEARTFPGADPTAAQIAVTERAESELGGVAEQLRTNGLEVEPHVYYDDAVTAILDAARRQKADLIVMSTHGRSGLGRWLYGSVADRVLRRAEVPVLLVPATCERTWPDDRALRILVPLDGSAFAEEALGPAGELATTLGAELLLLQIVEPALYSYGEGIPYRAADSEDKLAQARQYLDEVVSTRRTAGQAIQAQAELGLPAATIARVARERSIDLIALATHGHGGLARLVLGSVATGALQRAGVPLLLVRPVAMRRPILEQAATLEPAPVAESSAAPSEAEPVGPSVSVTLGRHELDLLERGLAELLYNPERDRHLAEPARRLLARLKREGLAGVDDDPSEAETRPGEDASVRSV